MNEQAREKRGLGKWVWTGTRVNGSGRVDPVGGRRAVVLGERSPVLVDMVDGWDFGFFVFLSLEFGWSECGREEGRGVCDDAYCRGSVQM